MFDVTKSKIIQRRGGIAFGNTSNVMFCALFVIITNIIIIIIIIVFVIVVVVVVVLKIGLNGRKLKRTKFAERSDPDVVRIETRTRLVHSPHADSFFCLYHYDLSRLRALFSFHYKD